MIPVLFIQQPCFTGDAFTVFRLVKGAHCVICKCNFKGIGIGIGSSHALLDADAAEAALILALIYPVRKHTHINSLHRDSHARETAQHESSLWCLHIRAACVVHIKTCPTAAVTSFRCSCRWFAAVKIYKYVCVFIWIYIYMDTYIHTYRCIYTHTHTAYLFI